MMHEIERGMNAEADGVRITGKTSENDDENGSENHLLLCCKSNTDAIALSRCEVSEVLQACDPLKSLTLFVLLRKTVVLSRMLRVLRLC